MMKRLVSIAKFLFKEGFDTIVYRRVLDSAKGLRT